jgi:S-disulfanyl-L-cysteine oxidoreductase SoxD
MEPDKGQAKAGLFLLLMFVFTAIGAAQSTDSTAPATVWQGVYSEAQAVRGQSEYATHCASCHRDDLSGYNNILKGARFMQKYRESSLHLLFDKTKTTMPRGAPATLSDKAYVDIVAYMLKANEFPAGTQELRVEDLQRIQLVGKDGPEPVPDFALVRVVGCLTTNPSDGAWMLAHSTDPVRTGNPQPATGEREAAEAWPLGPRTYRLLVSAAYAPESLKGHRVEVRGFLIRRPTENRLNITSLQTLDSSCGE